MRVTRTKLLCGAPMISRVGMTVSCGGPAGGDGTALMQWPASEEGYRHADHPTRHHRPRGFGDRLRLDGDVRPLWAGGGRRLHRHRPRRAGLRVTLLDTGDFHGVGHNEILLSEAWSVSRLSEG